MDMQPSTIFGYEVLANWQTLLLCMGIFVLAYIVRLVIQGIWKDWQKGRIYNNLVLHILPIVIGFCLAFAKRFPWPTQIAGSFWARTLYCMVCGMVCGWVYARVRSFVQMNVFANSKVSANFLPTAEAVVPEHAPAAIDEPTPVAEPVVVEAPKEAPKP